MPLIQTIGAGSVKALASSTGAETGPIYIQNVFSTNAYSGTGTTTTIVNNINLAARGGLVWIKSRNLVSNNLFLGWSGNDSLISNSTAAKDNSSYSITKLADGFTVSGSSVDLNNTSGTYVARTFRERSKFFDIVTYTGTGFTTQINHNLESAPGFIIAKNLSSSSDWYVYHRSVGGTKAGILNSTGGFFASNMWNSTNPNSSVFYLNASSILNQNGQSYIAFLFAHNAGGFGASGSDSVISCGSYLGNGSSSGPTINLGWQPRWILLKGVGPQYATSSNWAVFDTSVGGANFHLRADQTSAEVNEQVITVNASGFQVTTSSVNWNYAGYSYLQWSHNYSTSNVTISASSNRGTLTVYSVADTTAEPSYFPCFIFGSRAAGQWISYDFGSQVSINQLQYRNSVGPNWAPTEIQLQYSNDGSNWYIFAYYSDDGSTSVQNVYASATARFFRIYQASDTRANSDGYEWHFNNVRWKYNGSDVMIVNGSSTSTTVVVPPDEYIYVAIRSA